MLTETSLRALKPKSTVYRVADSGGLCIEVRPTGAKLWRYRYRYAGKASMVALGKHPEVSLQDARRKRDEARKVLLAGVSPSVNAKAQKLATADRAANTFGAIATEWFAQNEHRLTPGTLRRDRRVIEKHLNPWIGNAPMADIAPTVLLAALRKVQTSGALETAHRARALASRLFRYAIATGRATRNPASELIGALPAAAPDHFASITEPKQVAILMRRLHGYQGGPIVRAALMFAPLVFVRPGELRTALWKDMNLDAAEWRYTASKTGTPHVVPLATQSLDILRDLKPITGRSDYVFPSVRTWKRPMSENTINAALRGLGYKSDEMTGHGFRAMARTILDEELGFRTDFIEHQLAHAVRDPNGRAYNRTAHLAERRKMMQRWADYLDDLREKDLTV